VLQSFRTVAFRCSRPFCGMVQKASGAAKGFSADGEYHKVCKVIVARNQDVLRDVSLDVSIGEEESKVRAQASKVGFISFIRGDKYVLNRLRHLSLRIDHTPQDGGNVGTASRIR
jgi:hypothetical protein